jgi:hypothetical protein
VPRRRLRVDIVVVAAMSIIRPKFLQVLPDDIARVGVGADGACVLALVRYVTSLDGEHNGRVRIDGEMWWRASYAEIGESLGGVGLYSVRRIMLRLEEKGFLASRTPGISGGDQTKAYRTLSDQPMCDSATVVTSQCANPQGGVAESQGGVAESQGGVAESQGGGCESAHSSSSSEELKEELVEGGERGAEIMPIADLVPANQTNAPLPYLSLGFVPSQSEPTLGDITPPSRYCAKHQPSGLNAGKCWDCRSARDYRDQTWPITEDGRAYDIAIAIQCSGPSKKDVKIMRTQAMKNGGLATSDLRVLQAQALKDGLRSQSREIVDAEVVHELPDARPDLPQTGPPTRPGKKPPAAAPREEPVLDVEVEEQVSRHRTVEDQKAELRSMFPCDFDQAAVVPDDPLVVLKARYPDHDWSASTERNSDPGGPRPEPYPGRWSRRALRAETTPSTSPRSGQTDPTPGGSR